MLSLPRGYHGIGQYSVALRGKTRFADEELETVGFGTWSSRLGGCMDTCEQENTVNFSSYGLVDVERRPDGFRRRLDYVLHLFSKLDRCPPYHSRVVSHQQVEALQRPW